MTPLHLIQYNTSRRASLHRKMGLLVVYSLIFMVTIDNINAGGMVSVLSILSISEILSISS